MASQELRDSLSPVWFRASDVTAVRGEGIYLYDSEGNRYIDCTSGIGVVSTGHCHPRMVKAIQQQAEKTNIIVFQGGYHGRTHLTMAMTTSKTVYRVGYQPLIPGIHVRPSGRSAIPMIFFLLPMKSSPASAEQGLQLREGLKALQQRFPVIGEVRGKGLMVAVEFGETGKPDAERTRKVVAECQKRTQYFTLARICSSFYTWKILYIPHGRQCCCLYWFYPEEVFFPHSQYLFSTVLFRSGNRRTGFSPAREMRKSTGRSRRQLNS